MINQSAGTQPEKHPLMQYQTDSVNSFDLNRTQSNSIEPKRTQSNPIEHLIGFDWTNCFCESSIVFDYQT